MAAKLVKTRYRGIYKRGSRYVATYRVNGKQRRESARTLDEARAIKAARESDRNRGEFQAESRIPFATYAEEWIERYQGNGRRGFTDDTRDDYRRDLARYAIPFFNDRLGRTISSISPRDVSNWIAWICDEGEQGRRLAVEKGLPECEAQPLRLADATVRRILAPLRSCLATARREDLIRHNPADGAVLPNRPVVIEDADHVRALSREQLAAFLGTVNPRYRVMFRLLAATGLRWSEVIALRWADLRLDGSEPAVQVRRAFVRGKVKPPKSKYGRRNVPLDAGLVFELRRARRDSEWGGDDDLVFPSPTGAPLDHSNLLRRVLRPAAQEAGASWAGFHTLRHTCASLLFARGASAVQVQRWLGHHSPAFTLDTYIHLLPGESAMALDLGAELSSVANQTIDVFVEPVIALNEAAEVSGEG